MSEIAELENRLSAAMDRIAAGLTDLSGAPSIDASEEIEALKAALEEERTTNAQLEERIKVLSAIGTASEAAEDQSAEMAALKEAHARELQALKDAAAEERAAWEGLNQRLVRMRRSNKLMRSNTLALRQAASDMVVDASLINNSLQLELDATKAAQELERAEADVILKTLLPLVEGDGADVFEGEI